MREFLKFAVTVWCPRDMRYYYLFSSPQLAWNIIDVTRNKVFAAGSLGPEAARSGHPEISSSWLHSLRYHCIQKILKSWKTDKHSSILKVFYILKSILAHFMKCVAMAALLRKPYDLYVQMSDKTRQYILTRVKLWLFKFNKNICQGHSHELHNV